MAKKSSSEEGYTSSTPKRTQKIWGASKPTSWTQHKNIKDTNIPPIEQWLKEWIQSLPKSSNRTKKWVTITESIWIGMDVLQGMDVRNISTRIEIQKDALWRDRKVTIESYEDTIQLITNDWDHIEFSADKTTALISHDSDVAYLANQWWIQDKRVLSLEVEVEWRPNVDVPWYPLRKHIEKAAS